MHRPTQRHSLDMPWVAGVDGCKSGWVRVSRNCDSEELRLDVVGDVRELLSREPVPTLLALDIPIGLPDRGSRECDVGARKCLGTPRRNSVFPAPVRPSLSAASHQEASDITQRIDGRRVSAQAWGIYPKIKAIDQLLASSSVARSRIREVHPEVSFWAWNQRRSMDFAKKTTAGSGERLALAEDWLGSGVLKRLRGRHLKREFANDDVLDAIAALWTACRIVRGSAETLPSSPRRDSRGRPMEIVF